MIDQQVGIGPPRARRIAPPASALAATYGTDAAPLSQAQRDALITRYAHLVKYVVGRLGVSIQGVFDHEDAMQAGVIGLLRAIDAYKPDSVASFESYAIVRIRGSILDAIRALDPVGRAGRESARAIGGAVSELQSELDRPPSEHEIATRLGLTVGRYRERLQAASVVTVSLDEPDTRGDGDEAVGIADQAVDTAAIDPEDEATRRDDLKTLGREIGRLGERQQLVLSMYYSDELTFKEIGKVLGVTESRICQIHTETVLSLRARIVDPDIASRLSRRKVRS
jgi:RNA polymerase sigma factor for flagellar operon FliA